MNKKEFKTHNVQLRILRSRGVKIKNGSKTKRILENENYYNIINGYKDLFILKPETDTSDEIYKTNASFDEINALYEFDRNIRIIYLKYLLKIENNFKSVIAYNFSKKYGHDNYLKIQNFQDGPSNDIRELKRVAKTNKLTYPNDLAQIKKLSEEKNIAQVTKLIGDIQQEIARQMNKHHQVITHYMVNHGYIPMWVLVNVLTFGKITTLYYNLKESDKKDVARHFKIDYKELHKYMSMLGLARNKCAHDERFYNIKFKNSIQMNSISKAYLLGLQRSKDGSYTNGINDAFAIAVIFARTLKKNELKEFITLMSKEFKKLEKQLNTINIQEIYDTMGYPNNWKNLTKI